MPLNAIGQFIKVRSSPTPRASLRLIGADKNEIVLRYCTRSHCAPSAKCFAPQRTKKS
jgi:hypothetical protein